jgi:hypothetical protein
MPSKPFRVALCTLLIAYINRTSCCGLITRRGSSYHLRSSGLLYDRSAEDSKPVLHLAFHPFHLNFGDIFILQSPGCLVLKSRCCYKIYWRW